ncbi:MAG: 16S rRNA (cytidine(1402)-2'-O)-methyltransferase [Synergistaceae bacterium]|nr:16S rRNA (cytidine(1402)-2'-O)-methyltransferase [Synergistaceae bacterium]
MPLIVVPTPIGNLEDMTLRGLRVLREADIIACEDTRHTLKLLNYYEIKKPLISYHKFNETERLETLLKRIEEGETVALVSDAGTPCISDPGMILIQSVIERALPLDVLPGANAFLPAVILSGMGTGSFTFIGFLDGKRDEKRKRLEELRQSKETIVLYVAPHRLLKEMELIGGVLGDRPAALVKEISKIHQESIRGTLLTFKNILAEDKIRGEFVCVIEGARESVPDVNDSVWMDEALIMCKAGESTKNVANLLSIKYCIPRNRIKRYILENCTGEVI